MAYTFVAASTQCLYYDNALPIVDVNNRNVAISCWFKATTVANGTSQPMVTLASDYFGSFTYLDIGLRASLANAYARYHLAGTNYIAASTATISTATWYHLLGLFEYAPSTTRTDPVCYINGANSGTVTGAGSGINSTLYTWIGRGFGTTFADAAIAEVGIWYYSTVTNFTAGEIAMLAAGYSPPMVRSTDLVSYVPMVRNPTDYVWGNTFNLGNNPAVSDHPRIIYPARVRNLDLTPAAGAGGSGLLMQQHHHGGGL